MKKRVCLLVTLLAIVIMGFAMSVQAAEATETAEIIDQGYCGGEGDGTNLTWTLDHDGVLLIEGQGEMKDWTIYESDPESSTFQPTDWHKYYKEIYSIIINDGVTSIGSHAFVGCYNMSSVVLPESLKSMGNRVFCRCRKLSVINLPKSLVSTGFGIFMECSSLSSINLSESLTSIEGWSFYFCSSLRNIVLPESLTSIGGGAFYLCNVSRIILPESLACIDDGAFWSCYSLESIFIPTSVKTINESAFLNTGLKNIYYAGTENEWNSIQIISTENVSGYYNGLRNATVHYDSLPFDYYIVDAASYNKDLAFVAANLSLKAYDDGITSGENIQDYLVDILGFGEGSNFYTGSYGGTLAYTLATRKYYGTDADENTDILVITAQGSPNPYEMIPEAVSKPDYDNKKAFGGHVPYGIVEEYYNAIVEDLPVFCKPFL